MDEEPNTTRPSTPSGPVEADLAEMEHRLQKQLGQADKNPRDVLWQLVRLCNATKRHDQALQCLRRILASESDLEQKAGYFLALGGTMEECNDFPAAIVFYREAMTLEPSRNDAWYFIHNNLGYCYNQVGRFDEGEKYCRFAIQINQFRPNGYKNLGIALAAQGKYREAAVSYITGTFRHAGDARSFKLLQELIKEHPDLAFDFQAELNRCEKSIRFAAVALQRARSGRPFKIVVGCASSKWLNLCGYTLNGTSGGAVTIQVVQDLRSFVEAVRNEGVDLAFLALPFLAKSDGGTETNSWQPAVRAVQDIKRQKRFALVVVGTADELIQHNAAGHASVADAMLEATEQSDGLVEIMIQLLTKR